MHVAHIAKNAVGVLVAGATWAGVLSAAGVGTAPASALLVNGAPLQGARVGTSSTVTLVSPGARTVSWVLDGTYLGQDGSAPFELALKTRAGEHKLKARAESGSGVKTTYEVRFTAVGAPAVAPSPAPNPVPSPGPTPVPPPATGTAPSQGAVRTIRTTAELTSALRSARPGDVLKMADGTYDGRFVISTSGTAAAPIVLRGSRGAVLNGGSTSSGYTLHLSGASHWRLEGFSVRGAQKGIVLDRSNHNVLSGLDVAAMGMEAVHFRTASSDNRLENSAVHDTGLYEPGYGEGVYIGSATSNWSKYGDGGADRSDRNALVNNRIWATTAENIDVKEGTTGGEISGNVLDGAGMTGAHFADSWIDLKGNAYRVIRNTGTNTRLDGFQTHIQLDGWGRGNVFSGNVLKVNASGYGINVHRSDTSNRVLCDNVVTGAASGVSNIRCTS